MIQSLKRGWELRQFAAICGRNVTKFSDFLALVWNIRSAGRGTERSKSATSGGFARRSPTACAASPDPEQAIATC
jgi:hypothetical protein